MPPRRVNDNWVEAISELDCWGSLYPLYLDGIVEPDPRPVRKGDIVVITDGEYRGHVGQVEFISAGSGATRHNRPFASLRRLWPVNWRGPASSYWATEHRLEFLCPLVPKMPEFTSVEQADRWMEETRELAVGQDVEFILTPGSGMADWAHRYDPITYRGQLVEITELDTETWLRHRPAASGRFRVLHFDDDLNPVLTWVTSLVRV